MFPTVHMNGTNRDDLLEALQQAMQTLREARTKLALIAPNGRDFYVQGPDALSKALDEHCARMQKLLDVLRELEQQAEHLAFGPDNFGRRG